MAATNPVTDTADSSRYLELDTKRLGDCPGFGRGSAVPFEIKERMLTE